MMSGNGSARKNMPTNAAAASALADAEYGLQHDREHRRFQPEEQGDHQRHVAVGGVDVAERHD
jgi:hypothetical protein